jgi:hypothetical protein
MKKMETLKVFKNGTIKEITFDMYCRQNWSRLHPKPSTYDLWLIKNKSDLKGKWRTIHDEVNKYGLAKQKRVKMKQNLSNMLLVLLGSFVCGVAYFIVTG